MAYDERLADRVSAILAVRKDVTERKMFGGVAFMVGGNMAVGIVKDELMVRVGPEQHERLVSRPHARIMDFTGRPMRGFLFVAPEGVRTAARLREWVNLAVDYAVSQPKKKSVGMKAPGGSGGAAWRRRSR